MLGKISFLSVCIGLGAVALSASAAPAASAPFRPALLNSSAELDFIKGKIAAGAEPWKSAFTKMKANRVASLTYAAKPRDTVECGSYSNPDYGCSDESNDSKAAYSDALLWIFTGNEAYAAKSAEILDAWSGMLKRHTNSNAPLQAAWTGAVFPRAAQILRNTYPGWPAANQARFSRMLDTAFFPLIRSGNPTYNGNWELSYIEALMAGGIFNADTAAYNRGVFLWRKRVPAYFYLKSDGAQPVKPYGTTSFDNAQKLVTYWYNPGVWPDGLSQETCRDFGHTQMGLAAMVNAAEIAWHQGLDLYSGEADRITTAMEFHAGLLSGNAPPAGLCGDSLGLSTGATWEIAYNHFHNRMGRDLPLTMKWILATVRPSGIGTHMAWETLTHAELGSVADAVAKPRAGLAGETFRTGLALQDADLVLLRDGMAYTLAGKRIPAARKPFRP
jgi:Alginate lyase